MANSPLHLFMKKWLMSKPDMRSMGSTITKDGGTLPEFKVSPSHESISLDGKPLWTCVRTAISTGWGAEWCRCIRHNELTRQI